MSFDSGQIFCLAEKAHKKVTDAKVRLSFQYIDWTNDTFFVHGLNNKYYHKLFDVFHQIKQATVDQIRKQTHPSLEVKSIRWKSASYITQKSFPETVMDDIERSLLPQAQAAIDAKLQAIDLVKDAFELSLSKNYGRIHGFLYGDTFHLVWFDPAHNLFPGMTKRKKNPVTPFKKVQQVKDCSPEAVNQLRKENDGLRQELDEALTLLDKATAP